MGVFTDLNYTTYEEHIEKNLLQALQNKQITNGFKGEIRDTFSILTVEQKVIILIGLGKKEEFTHLQAERAGGVIFDTLKANKYTQADVLLNATSKLLSHLAYGVLRNSFTFRKYKTKEKECFILENINIITKNKEEAKNTFITLKAEAESEFITKELVTIPPNHLYPASYAERICTLSEKVGLNVQVLNEKEMCDLHMNALLGVGQGSTYESKLVVMHWQGSEQKPIALVGKGVTFDTGGISLKPANHMWDMKYDMAGSATVVGTMHTLASRKAPANVVGVVGLVENAISGNAQRPSDVVKSMSGQTIEVLNTDAEGRLVLADALCYVQEKFAPQCIIDLATLTGAIIVALGNHYAGLFSNDTQLAEKLSNIGEEIGQRVWRLPLGKEYDKEMDSKIADVQNISLKRGEAGSITAAQFLQRFIQKNTAWAHLDIAGVAWNNDNSIGHEGATGFGVRLLNAFIKKYYE